MLLIILVLADLGTRVWAERRVETAVATSFRMPERPDVRLGGFPFLPRLIDGTLPEVSVDVGRVAAEGISFDSVDLDLRDVDFSAGDLLAGEQTDIHAAGGTGTAAMTGPDLTAAFRAQGIPVSVRLVPGGVTLSSDVIRTEVEAQLALVGQSIEVRPANIEVPFALSLELPPFLRGLEYTGLRIDGSEALLSFRLRDVTLALEQA